jgi:hypothetical protein
VPGNRTFNLLIEGIGATIPGRLVTSSPDAHRLIRASIEECNLNLRLAGLESGQTPQQPAQNTETIVGVYIRIGDTGAPLQGQLHLQSSAEAQRFGEAIWEGLTMKPVGLHRGTSGTGTLRTEPTSR